MKQVITIAITRKQAQPAPNYGQKEKQAQTQAQPQTQAADSTLPAITIAKNQLRIFMEWIIPQSHENGGAPIRSAGDGSLLPRDSRDIRFIRA